MLDIVSPAYTHDLYFLDRVNFVELSAIHMEIDICIVYGASVEWCFGILAVENKVDFSLNTKNSRVHEMPLDTY